MTEAYSHTCDNVVRKMRWEPLQGEYGMLTVEDTVESRSENFIKAFHIHCQTEPKHIDNSVIIDNGSYALICRILSPESAKIELIGGEGRQFEVDGVNYDTNAKENTEAGWGQIVVSDTLPRKKTEFKLEMEIIKKENI